MKTEFDRWLLAYLGYLVWLCAGLFDFLCHRRSDLPHTSGLAESRLHVVQLGVIGTALLLAMVFEVGKTLVLLTLALVVVHAVVGYLDTRRAFGRRTLLPVEQHLHSVLDMAPIIAWAGLAAVAWPALAGSGWVLALRRPALELQLWIAMLLPALLLCVVPAALEFRAAWVARAATPHRGD
ncbi:hypothetical protein IP90_02275 [Luteimonas cucumeris]|uniref:Transmembrane protein n=1 Tax=Luteimonas cucumeris TaxID=985012 RepID=A0A562L252_9GAMM|nr:hypothetical protein [Luteimonas cucumeris]TWI01715.1 hypothetical protein IP90_02275 [Luteimonas cucumeris]